VHRNCFFNRSDASQYAVATKRVYPVVKLNVNGDTGYLVLNKNIWVLTPSDYDLFWVYEARALSGESNEALYLPRHLKTTLMLSLG
jgi:hypothetical protein